MEKLPLPSTPTTSSLICQAWAGGKFPASDLRPSPCRAPRSSYIVVSPGSEPEPALCKQQTASNSFLSPCCQKASLPPPSVGTLCVKVSGRGPLHAPPTNLPSFKCSRAAQPCMTRWFDETNSALFSSRRVGQRRTQLAGELGRAPLALPVDLPLGPGHPVGAPLSALGSLGAPSASPTGRQWQSPPSCYNPKGLQASSRGPLG